MLRSIVLLEPTPISQPVSPVQWALFSRIGLMEEAQRYAGPVHRGTIALVLAWARSLVRAMLVTIVPKEVPVQKGSPVRPTSTVPGEVEPPLVVLLEQKASLDLEAVRSVSPQVSSFIVWSVNELFFRPPKQHSIWAPVGPDCGPVRNAAWAVWCPHHLQGKGCK